MSQVRVIDAATVQALLPYGECVPLMREAFLAEAAGRAIQPLRQAFPAPDGKGLLGIMPGVLSDPDWLGAKVISVFPGNAGTSHGSHQGAVLLFEREHGELIAILDGREVTAIRTAAASAAATDVLARVEASSVGVFGYGEQARAHVAAIDSVRDVNEILLWGRDPERTLRLAEEIGPRARTVGSPREAAQADILCLVTAAREPYFEGAWLRPGQHLNVVGSSIPSAAEVDSETLVRSRLFVDYEPSARVLGGEIRRALESGAIGEEHILGSIGQILAGAVDGRRTDEDITLFKSLGMVAEDLIAAAHVFRAAEASNKGAVVPF